MKNDKKYYNVLISIHWKVERKVFHPNLIQRLKGRYQHKCHVSIYDTIEM